MNSILSTKSFDLLPNELLHLVLAPLLFVDYDMLHRSPVPFLARRAEAMSLSLVCHRWRRVAVPLIYESVILTSKSEAKTLVSMLRHVGPYIKKLRIEGGYGHSIHIILSKIPSKQKAGGLCSGLKFINPKHVVLRDSQVLRNQGVSNVIDVLIECMTSVSAIGMYFFFYWGLCWLNNFLTCGWWFRAPVCAIQYCVGKYYRCHIIDVDTDDE
jgi:F-box-like